MLDRLSLITRALFFMGLLASCQVGDGRAASVPSPIVPDGFEVSLYASDELLSNPVAITFDQNERLYVAEARRKETGVWGVTFSRWWAMEDYQAKTMQEREAMYLRWSHVVPEIQMRAVSEIVRVISDRNGDGRADHSAVFADQFNHPLDGNAAGVLAIDGSVYLACIPHLWRLRDRDQDFSAEIRESLHSGFGVRVGVHGHDLHGLIQGPDGKLYFTIGDRGYDVTTREGKRLHASHRGAVFRCNPDGSRLEVFHKGLRNPQELAFNDWGDLFTVDNNMSGGDECRVLYLVEGADSAWDATYQLSGHFREETDRMTHPKPPWFSERLWAPEDSHAPLWHHAAVANLSRGPGGLAYYPGTGLGENYANTFFLADFVGNPTTSEVLTFRLERDGAGYRLVNQSVFARSVLATDIEFGADGALYIADWINGWTGTGAGRVWRVRSISEDDHNESVRLLLRRGFETEPSEKLVGYLGHPDRRVRYQAQFALVRRGSDGERHLVKGFEESKELLSRIHSLWGLGQLAEAGALGPTGLAACVLGLGDSDPEVRTQAAKISRRLPNARWVTVGLVACLADPNPRALFQALLTLAHREEKSGVAGVIGRLSSELGDDRMIRHAGVSYLANVLSEPELGALAEHSSARVRRCAVLALRRLRSPWIESFLTDPDRPTRFAALRAIHDLPIRQQVPAVASLILDEDWMGQDVPFPVAQRIINANYRLGKAEHAVRLAEMAGRGWISHPVRLEALRALQAWSDPSVFDRVTWHHRPLEGSRAEAIGDMIREPILNLYRSLRENLTDLDDDQEGRELLLIVNELMIRHRLITIEAARDGLVREILPTGVRVAYLRFLVENAALPVEVAERVLESSDPKLAPLAAGYLADRGEDSGWRFFEETLRHGGSGFLGESIDTLASLHEGKTEELLSDALWRATRKQVSTSVWLNLVEASEQFEALTDELQQFLKSLGMDPVVRRTALSREGGNPKLGEQIFKQHVAQCQRCHQIDGNGGKAGPDLSKIGLTLSKDQIIESLLVPNRRIAPGFGTLTLELANGDELTGIAKSEDSAELKLILPDFQEIVIRKSSIERRTDTSSSMPPMGDVLTRRELRDLVAYLGSLR